MEGSPGGVPKNCRRQVGSHQGCAGVHIRRAKDFGNRHSMPQPAMPLAAACLEPPHHHRSWLQRPRPHRTPAASGRTPAGLSSRLAPPSFRPSFRSPRASREKHKTRNSFHQSSRMRVSCFDHYKSGCSGFSVGFWIGEIADAGGACQAGHGGYGLETPDRRGARAQARQPAPLLPLSRTRTRSGWLGCPESQGRTGFRWNPA